MLALTACEKKKKQGQVEAAYIYRKSDESFYTPGARKAVEPPSYAWDNRYVGDHFRITKEFFRCKGSSANPMILENQIASDCNGAHSLPLKEGKECVYPLLIDLLNYLQEKTKKQVVITTGHRCLKHNHYADPTIYNRASMHMIGAEVDSYVEGENPKNLVQLIQDYYLEDEEVNSDPDFTTFKRYEKDNVNVRTKPWYNQEVFVKLYEADEGRDFDNQHAYPYLSVQMRYDREKKQKVRFTFEDAEKLLHEN